jgi:glutaredoxin-like protein
MEKMLNNEVIEQVRDVFAELKKPVKILFFENNQGSCEYCEPTRQLLSEVVELSEHLSLSVYDIDEDQALAEQYHVDKTPATVIAGWDDEKILDYGVRLLGIPAGHEFTSLIRNILMVSSRDSGLSPETRTFLSKLDKPLHMQVFVTPTCPYCPQAVILAHQFAMESAFVEAEMVEAMEFPDLSNQFGVSGVPHTIFNSGLGEFVGAMPESHVLEKLQQIMG